MREKQERRASVLLSMQRSSAPLPTFPPINRRA
jgi:hypothetical protein